MREDFKKIFFSSLLTILFVISNLVGLKYTTFMGMIVSVNFITYPFIMLCILIITDSFGKKETYYSIISTVFIQIILLLSYSLAVKMNNQSIIPDLSSYVNTVFLVDEVSILASLIGFMVSNYIIIFLFNTFKKLGKKILGVIFGTFSSLIIYGLISILICYYNIEREILTDLLLSHVFISVIMTFIITILFYTLKDRDCIYTNDDSDDVALNTNYNNNIKFADKTILEVINIDNKNNGKKTNYTSEEIKKNSLKKSKRTSDTSSKTVNKSKTVVKK